MYGMHDVSSKAVQWCALCQHYIHAVTCLTCMYQLLTLLQGDLVLRDGGYVSERDAFTKLEGLYVAATGRLHAVLNPVDDVQLSLAQEDLDMHTADYRWADFACSRPSASVICSESTFALLKMQYVIRNKLSEGSSLRCSAN